MKHAGNKHMAKAQAYLRRAGYAEGGEVDDDQPTPMQMHQTALDHVAARGEAAIDRQVSGVGYHGRNTSADGENADDDQDIKNFRDTFNPEEGDREVASAQRHLLDKYGKQRGGRVSKQRLDRAGRKRK